MISIVRSLAIAAALTTVALSASPAFAICKYGTPH